MIVSRITSKAQTTVPRAVRIALGLRQGDSIEYVIEGDHVLLRRAAAGAEDDPFVMFEEWASEADAQAYANF